MTPKDEARFIEKLDSMAPWQCWQWTSATARGYGYFNLNGEAKLAHRLAYELFVGPIPEGLVLDHLCLNKRCCNPDHLDPVMQAENLRRARA